MNKQITTTVYYGATVSILFGFALLLAAFAPARLSDWGDIASGCVPQVILIVGGLLAMAISSLSTSDQGGNK